MAGPRRRRQPHRRKRREKTNSAGVNLVERLPPDILAEIHRRLTFLDRIALALVVRRESGGHVMTSSSTDSTRPWLFLPWSESDETAIVDHKKTVAVPTCDPAMRGGHVVVGSIANPVTGAQAELPSIATIPLFTIKSGLWYILDGEAFARLRFDGDATLPRTLTMTADQLRTCFYRKVVLSASPRSDGFAAMLVTAPIFGAPAFATSQDPNWRFAPSRDGVEDAIHHDGRFYSLTYSGLIEAWDRDTGGSFTSKVVAPRLTVACHDKFRRKYLAVAPDERFMVVFKESSDVGTRNWMCAFKVHVLDAARRAWKEEPNVIADMDIFVGANSSICVSTTEHPELRAGCVYFTEDDIGEASLRQEDYMSYRVADDDELWNVAAYSFKKDRVDKVIVKPQEYPRWPLPAWFTPSVF